jgi:peptide/nickel transport system permease protein
MTITATPLEPIEDTQQSPLPMQVGSGRDVLRALLRDRTAVLGIFLVTVLVLGALLAKRLAPYDPNAIDVVHRLQSPSLRHYFGTDYLGRDIFSRILFGARLSLGSAVLAGVATSSVGLVIGMVAGYFGGLVDLLISRVMDVLLAFPLFLLALAITGIIGPGLHNLLIALILASWAQYARIVRGAVLAEKNKLYVEAARAVGAGNGRVLRKHLLPNIVAPVVVLTTLDTGVMMLALSGLSFLGLGVRPPTAEWGAMLSEGRLYLDHSQMMVFPGLAIFAAVLGFNLLGDGLRDALDPRTRHGRRRAGTDGRGHSQRRGVLRLVSRPHDKAASTRKPA